MLYNFESMFDKFDGDSRISVPYNTMPMNTCRNYPSFSFSSPGPILQQKAMMFAKQFPNESETFTASSGWLDRWKKRHVS